ncbi:MAG: hypothetical protein KC422_23160 [Trueperaceae bacterium]|nr:hypothetical protein [Trueperaceae bacterium]
MTIDSVYHQIKEKQQTYEAQADLWRQLPKTKLSYKLARLMRHMADRLEPQPLHNQSLVERTC